MLGGANINGSRGELPAYPDSNDGTQPYLYDPHHYMVIAQPKIEGLELECS